MNIQNVHHFIQFYSLSQLGQFQDRSKIVGPFICLFQPLCNVTDPWPQDQRVRRFLQVPGMCDDS
jgi:hypothetical protein